MELFPSIRPVSRAGVMRDSLAGLTLAAMNVPQALGYTKIAGMPVVTGAGLVGRVTQVTGGRSVVQLITDPGFDLGVRLVESGDVGIAHGTGEDQPLVVDAGIDLRTTVNEGDSVTTSGVDRSIFPPDIPIGQVDAVETAADQLTQVLHVELLADLDNLAYVRVLQWTPPEPVGG